MACRLLLLASALLVAPCVQAQLATPAAHGLRGVGPVLGEVVTPLSMARVSSKPGVETTAWSSGSAMSADGAVVAFTSVAENLVPGDENGVADVFVRDMATGTIEVVSRGLGGRANGASGANVSLSADGRYVAFDSDASNLVASDTNGASDVFIFDRATATTTRASVSSSGAQVFGESLLGDIDALGRFVTFSSSADTLVANDLNGVSDVFLHDSFTGSTIRASMNEFGIGADQPCMRPTISADGRYVAYVSDAQNLVPGDLGPYLYIFVFDRGTGLTHHASVNSSGVNAHSHSDHPSLSADGRFVAFTSMAYNLVSKDTNFTFDIFVHDVITGDTQRVSTGPEGMQLSAPSLAPSISADGRYVAYETVAANLVAGDTNGVSDVFVHDRATGTTSRVSDSIWGGVGNAGSTAPSLAADGSCITFSSFASDLVPNDHNGVGDVFWRSLESVR